MRSHCCTLSDLPLLLVAAFGGKYLNERVELWTNVAMIPVHMYLRISASQFISEHVPECHGAVEQLESLRVSRSVLHSGLPFSLIYKNLTVAPYKTPKSTYSTPTSSPQTPACISFATTRKRLQMPFVL